jgi:hypothetical protein
MEGSVHRNMVIIHKVGLFVFFLILTLSTPIASNVPVETIWAVSSFGNDDYFHQPSDIEADLSRELIYIADSGNHRILVFDFLGKFLKIIGGEGQGPSEFSRPTGLYVFEDGGLAVADVGNRRIQIFDGNGEYAKSINTKSVQVADMIFFEEKIYTIMTFGHSGYSLKMDSEIEIQPLVNILDSKGDFVKSITILDYPESQPFLRAIKHRVCLAQSKEDKLYIPHFAMNLIHIFDLKGNKISEFDRPLPFKPGAPELVRLVNRKDGRLGMRADFDFVTKDARFGPDGYLYLLTYTESYMERAKRKEKGADLLPHPMRIEMLDATTHDVVRYIKCDDEIRAFDLLTENRIAYIYVGSEDEETLKCVKTSNLAVFN